RDAGLAKGAALFGVGMLFDLAGSDSYRGARFVQGFGGTRGLGAPSDLSGNDTYYAGGKYSHAPLLPENYQSLSQGFAFGLRGAPPDQSSTWRGPPFRVRNRASTSTPDPHRLRRRARARPGSHRGRRKRKQGAADHPRTPPTSPLSGTRPVSGR